MKRPATMSFELYKRLRSEFNSFVKEHLKGTFIWESGQSWRYWKGMGLKNDNGEPITDGELPRGRTFTKPKLDSGEVASPRKQSESETVPVGEL